MSDDEQEPETDLGPDDDELNAATGEGGGDSNITAKEAERQRIQAEIEAFLQRGGQITQVDSNVMADPPKPPESNYGGQPI